MVVHLLCPGSWSVGQVLTVRRAESSDAARQCIRRLSFLHACVLLNLWCPHSHQDCVLTQACSSGLQFCSSHACFCDFIICCVHNLQLGLRLTQARIGIAFFFIVSFNLHVSERPLRIYGRGWFSSSRHPGGSTGHWSGEEV